MYETDQRLKYYLDTNQLHREQLCLAVLSLDKRFSNIRPRHPRGGPDGGRDIEATFDGKQTAYVAIGFQNQAADTEEYKKAGKKKFLDDMESAWAANPQPNVFVFLTNINLTIGEKSELILKAKERGFGFCEIVDRERIRISLDSPDGFAARIQYLGIPMSDAEQTSFFAKWGDDINSVIATGFQQIHSTLAHILFLQEASRPLSSLYVVYKLDREYTAEEIGHFRAFFYVTLREEKLGISQILIGSTDISNRFRKAPEDRDQPSGIKNGFSSGQWLVSWSTDSNEKIDDDLKYQPDSLGSSAGVESVKQLVISYSTPSFIRFTPVLSLLDFDEAIVMPILNKSLAEKLESIKVFGDGYLIQELSKDEILLDNSDFSLGLSPDFSETELSDPWVRLRLKAGFNMRFSFSDVVPSRVYTSGHANAKNENLRP